MSFRELLDEEEINEANKAKIVVEVELNGKKNKYDKNVSPATAISIIKGNHEDALTLLKAEGKIIKLSVEF